MSGEPEHIPDEIEITREMLEAGANAVFTYREDLMAWGLAEQVYRAMERERVRPRGKVREQ